MASVPHTCSIVEASLKLPAGGDSPALCRDSALRQAALQNSSAAGFYSWFCVGLCCCYVLHVVCGRLMNSGSDGVCS